jgi:hypothetical protein
VEVVHRFHSGEKISKDTLTLVVQSHSDTKDRWKEAVTAFVKYVDEHDLKLKVKIIDHRIILGPYTLPILEDEHFIKIVNRMRFHIKKILEESGEQWTSLEFWYRGVGPMRAGYFPTVLVGGVMMD